MLCGECGEALTIVQTDTYGCSNHCKKGICSNETHIDRKEMTKRVLSNLMKIMSDVQYVDHFIQDGNKALETQYAYQTAEQAQTKRSLKKVRRDIEATLINLSKGPGSNSLLEQPDKLEEEEKRLDEKIVKTHSDYPDVNIRPNKRGKLLRDQRN
tara:strand:+ start:4901 stop:5365 length:465 start_codon:yes stop_codon:yes gene_type:complete